MHLVQRSGDPGTGHPRFVLVHTSVCVGVCVQGCVLMCVCRCVCIGVWSVCVGVCVGVCVCRCVGCVYVCVYVCVCRWRITAVEGRGLSRVQGIEIQSGKGEGGH